MSSCTPESAPSPPKQTFDGSWEEAGLEGITVKSLNNFNGSVYAATQSGLYRTSLRNNKNSWKSIGLQKDTVLNVVFLPGNRLLASVRISDCCSGIPSLFLSANGGQSWQSYMNNYGGPTGKVTWVETMAEASKPSDTLFTQTAAGGSVAWSVDGGKHWKMVHGSWNDWGGFGILLFIDPYKKSIIWAGGSNAFSGPVLIKSKDYGSTWERKEKGLGGVGDLIVNAHYPDQVLVAAVGIAKSMDDGNSWHYISSVHFSASTFEYSARNPMIIYVSGQNKNGTLFFAASRDFSDTWKTVTMPNSPTGITINDMVSVMQNGHEALYFGTTKGVYSYTFKK